MDAVIVYKADGTLQCTDLAAIPLDQHAAELKELGASKIFGQGNVHGPLFVTSLCGAPTGRVNAFAISHDDWERVSSGIVGLRGFRLWSGAPLPDLQMDQSCKIVPARSASPASPQVATMPTLIRELIGRPCRCYREGDGLSQDFIPERVNIEHNAEGRINDIWFG